MHFNRTRLAPTPSGYLHAGNALSFLLTAAMGKKYGARMQLRIDDIDQERVRKEFIADIFDTLRFLDIPWDEGPRDPAEYETHYSQVHRLPLYEEALRRLKAMKMVFACDCSRSTLTSGRCECRDKKLSLDQEGLSWRLDTGRNTELVVNTPGESISARLPGEMRHFVVRRKNGLPSYQLASAVDDVHFGVDLVVRGQDLWPSTLAQLYLMTVLEEKRFLGTCFHHHPLLTDQDGKKLSKSAGAMSIRHYREKGKDNKEVLELIRGLGGRSILTV